MQIYFAGADNKLIDEYCIKNDIPRLFSYLNDKSTIHRYKIACRENKYSNKLFIDSGAFTAWTIGATIDVDTYIEWLNDNSDCIGLFGQVDSIPGKIDGSVGGLSVEQAANNTWDNFLYMRSKLLNPGGLLYTFHFGEPFYFLEQALSYVDDNGHKLDYIAIGGLVGKTYVERERFLTKVFNIIYNSTNSDIKVHGFGMTDTKLLEKYPFTTVDSTGWLMVGGMGKIITEYGVLCVSNKQQFKCEHFSSLPTETQIKLNNEITKFDTTLNELSDSVVARKLFNLKYLYNWVSKLPDTNYKIVKSLF